MRAGTDGVRLVLRPHPAVTIHLVSAETGEDAWVLRLEAQATLRGTSTTVSQVLDSPRKRRVNEATFTLDAPGEYDVSVKASGCPEQQLRVTLGPDEWKTVKVLLPRVE